MSLELKNICPLNDGIKNKNIEAKNASLVPNNKLVTFQHPIIANKPNKAFIKCRVS